MTNAKSLSAKQLTVIEDLFAGELDEQKILEKHKLSRKLYNKWLADEAFSSRLESRLEWEKRRFELMLVRKAGDAVSSLAKLAESEKGETARKACLDIITMQANHLTGTPTTPGDSPAPTPESPQFSPETAGKLLAVLAREKGAEYVVS